MPLLKRKAFEKSTVADYLRDDDEVFHCEITGEIFKDYEEYCERIILVNSMVWSCEMTGKNNLTYAEALESEANAKRSLKDFPMELRIPILFLASKTMRSSFAEMTEDVFNFVRERYFIGETVEACLEGDSWNEAHILSVTAPKQQPDSKITLPASAYCYEVEQYLDESEMTGQVGTAPHDRIRRRKGIYSRDKNKLFLKQFVEQGPGGLIIIKNAALEKYNISKVRFDQLFTGSIPEFPSSKKLIKNSLSPGLKPKSKGPKKPSPDKKGRQESMDKFVKKTDKSEIIKNKPVSNKKSIESFAEEMRKAGEQMRQKKLEEKERLKEKNARLQAYIKAWQKTKDDLELEDHKIIPKGTLVELEGIPQSEIGDLLSVLEFLHLYSQNQKSKILSGLDVDLFRKALTVKDYASVFCDIINFLLTMIFSLQDDEAEEYNEGGSMVESTDEKMDGEVGVTKAVQLATKASKWSQTYQGLPLRNLPLTPTVITEVLRLHLLSSGSEAGSRCAVWRYQERGGYSSHDDAGLRLRRAHPELLRRLHTTHVADLPIDDKFKILQCLMNQIISYSTIRDVIEEKVETLRLKRHELRMVQVQLRRSDTEKLAMQSKLRKESIAKKAELKLTGESAKAHDEQLRLAIEQLAKDCEAKKEELEKAANQLHKKCFDYLSYLGSDRGYRRYWLNQRVAGVFVEAGSESRGPCLDKPVLPISSTTDDTLAYVKTLFEKERASSDKENDSAANSRGNSPKKPLSNLNGLSHKLNGLEVNTQLMRDLYVCTGNINTCLVHGKEGHPQWTIYNTEEQLESLIQSLNKRGIRESELRQTLEVDKPRIVQYLKQCPMHMLTHTQAQPAPATRHKKSQSSLVIPAECSLSEALELALRDAILELEEKIFHGCLGALDVKDREAWRGTIMLRGYDKQAEFLSWGPNRQYRDDYHLHNGQIKVPQGDNKDAVKLLPENKYRDPGYYLIETTNPNGVKQEEIEDSKAASLQVVRGLASALLQVSQCINHKYLKRPLGYNDKERKDAKGKPLDTEALERWEVSLMECRGFAQVAMHLSTLDSSVAWKASILNASCRICHRRTDPDNMLLCDNCNKGHHLYCLKPKLTRVPPGDWFCEQCKPKDERAPRKRRKLFSDEDMVEALKSESEEEEENEEDEEEDDDDDDDDDADEEAEDEEDINLCVCSGCGSGGRLATTCLKCRLQWHSECAVPRPPRGSSKWICKKCKTNTREHSTRRCAAMAINNIHQYARQLSDSRVSSETEDSDDNVSLLNVRGRRSRASKEPSPVVNGISNGHEPTGGRRSRKSKDEPSSRRSLKSGSNTPVPNGHINERHVPKTASSQKRKRSSRNEQSLHKTELEQLLADLMKHKDCWPFYEPVNMEDVPDYFNIIQEPMDFATIKGKLELGEYTADEEFMNDAALVFTNCYTYNKQTHIVAKTGIRLQRYFTKRCSELNLPTMPAINPNDYHEGDAEEDDVSDDEDPPKTKRSKHK